MTIVPGLRASLPLTAVACLMIGTLVRISGQGIADRVNAMQVTKPTDRSIVLSRSFAASRQRVFEALTKPDRVPALVSAEADVACDLRGDFSSLTLLVTTVLDEVRGKTVMTQTIEYSSKISETAISTLLPAVRLRFMSRSSNI